MKITEGVKWHITGYITDFAPKPEKVSSDYFEKCEEKRKQDLIKQF